MEGFKGAPGKWFYSDSLGEVKSLKGLLVADLIVNGKEDDNGRLIAAAPELLEALQEVVAAIKITLRVGHDRIIELGGECDSPEVMIMGHSEIARAEVAIAKALGQ